MAKGKAGPGGAGKQKRSSKSAQARAYKAEHPTATTQQIADALKMAYQTVYQALNSNGQKKKTHRKKAKAPQSMHGALDTAFDFVQQVGGLIHAEKLIDKLKQFKER